MGQILIIVSVVLTFLTAVFGFLNQGKLSTARSEADSAKQALTGAQTKAAKAEGDLKKATETVSTLTTEKEQTVAQLTAAQSELNTAKTKAKEQDNAISEKEQKITQLTTELDDAKQKIGVFENAGTGKTAEPSADVLAQIEEQKTVISGLQGDLDKTRTELEDYRKKAADQKALRMQQGLEGKILAVNQAWNFVVLNLGDRNGVVNNAEMLIKRGTQLVGKVRITSVEPSTSIADIVANSVPGGIAIQPGDNVIFDQAPELP